MIDRRTFLRSSAGAVTLGGMVMMTTPSAFATPTQVSAELARLIEAHDAARVAMEAQYGDVDAAERAFYRNESDETLRTAKDEAQEIQTGLFKAESAAFLALLSYPVSTLDELRTIVAIGQKTWWNHDALAEEEGEALVAGIMGGLS